MDLYILLIVWFMYLPLVFLCFTFDRSMLSQTSLWKSTRTLEEQDPDNERQEILARSE